MPSETTERIHLSLAEARERARLAREGIEIDRRIHDALIQLAKGKRDTSQAVEEGPDDHA